MLVAKYLEKKFGARHGFSDRAELASVMSYSAFETKRESPAVFGLDEHALQVRDQISVKQCQLVVPSLLLGLPSAISIF